MLIPARKTLQQIDWLTPEQIREVRHLVSGTTKTKSYQNVQAWIRQCYHPPGYLDRLLCALNEICETFGVEALYKDGQVFAEYLNTGHTYQKTLVYRHDLGRLQVTSWGDLVEQFSLEKKGMHHVYYHNQIGLYQRRQSICTRLFSHPVPTKTDPGRHASARATADCAGSGVLCAHESVRTFYDGTGSSRRRKTQPVGPVWE